MEEVHKLVILNVTENCGRIISSVRSGLSFYGVQVQHRTYVHS